MLLWAIIIFSVTSSIYGQENILEERIEALEKKTAALELKAESTQLRFEIGLFNTVENIILNLRNLQSSITATKTDQEITQNMVNKSTFKDDFSPTPVKSPCPIRKSNVCDCPNRHVVTGKSLSEALLFAEHGENMLCTNIVLNVRNKFCTQHVSYTSSIHENSKLRSLRTYCVQKFFFDIQNNFCTQHVLPMFCKEKSF